MKRLPALCLCLIMLFSACSKASPSPEESPEPSPSPLELPSPSKTPAPSPSPSPTPEPLEYNPLTGLNDTELIGARPMAIMMNNLKKALPMSGVSQADVIYECLAEGGITRMLAFFQDVSKAGNIGTVRSTRTYYLELALGHDALLIHAGASYMAYDEIAAWKVDNLDYVRNNKVADMFWRDKARIKSAGSEHSVYTSGEKITAMLEKLKIRTDHEEGYRLGWSFVDDGTPATGGEALTVSAPFTASKITKFLYNGEEKLYYVEEYNDKFMDEAQKQQVAVTNVITLYTGVAPIPGDKEGRISVRLTGEGTGFYACGGKYVPIRWSKKSRNDPFVFTFEDGKALELGRGKSYICIIPDERTVTFS